MIQLIRLFLTACMILLLGGCGQPNDKYQYRIGRDPTWYPLYLDDKTPLINAFTNSFIKGISKVVNVPFEIMDVSWFELYRDFDKGAYPAVLTSLSPNLITASKYAFSDPFLELGPVLIVTVDADEDSLGELEGKLVGVSPYDDAILLVQQHPTIIPHFYNNMPMALEDLAHGKIDAVLMGSLEANSIVPQLYSGKLKIVSPPLNDKALRLIVRKGENEWLVSSFNKGLKKLQDSNIYTQLKKRYYLINP